MFSTKAAKNWRLAAKQGNATSQYNLGVLYEKGEGVKADLNKAFKYYLLVAVQKYGKAQRALGRFYYSYAFKEFATKKNRIND